MKKQEELKQQVDNMASQVRMVYSQMKGVFMLHACVQMFTYYINLPMLHVTIHDNVIFTRVPSHCIM